jgi:WXG100 family type VII secretion target
MADINVDYDAVVRSANRLRSGRGQLDQKLNQLKSMIDNLISSQFKTTAASGKLGDAYTRFTNAARRSIEALDGMGSYLESVKQQHEELDQNLAGGFGSLGPRG